MLNIENLTTETVNETTKHIDTMDSLGIVTLINDEDKKVALAIQPELPQIAKAVDAIAERFTDGGRIIYAGAGSSGRIGALDAVELTPTYSVPPDRAFGLLAGNNKAMYAAAEDAEDSKELALEDLQEIGLNSKDCIIGIAASGRTPYTISALEYAKEVGALTISVTCNSDSPMAGIADISIAPVVGPEVISGSTRMKAGTAQKMVVNMLSTGTMIRLGKVYQNYMVHVQPTNEKLVVRAVNIISQITGKSTEQSKLALEQSAMNVAAAIVMMDCNCSKEESLNALEQSKGMVRKAIELVKTPLN